jgi:hypothetical protein
MLGALDSKHMLINLKATPHGGLTDAHCFLCLAFTKKFKVHCGCAECQKTFHPMCYNAFHCRNALKNEVRLLIDLTLQATEKKGYNKCCKNVGGIEHAQFSFLRSDV